MKTSCISSVEKNNLVKDSWMLAFLNCFLRQMFVVEQPSTNVS